MPHQVSHESDSYYSSMQQEDTGLIPGDKLLITKRANDSNPCATGKKVRRKKLPVLYTYSPAQCESKNTQLGSRGLFSREAEQAGVSAWQVLDDTPAPPCTPTAPTRPATPVNVGNDTQLPALNVTPLGRSFNRASRIVTSKDNQVTLNLQQHAEEEEDISIDLATIGQRRMAQEFVTGFLII